MAERLVTVVPSDGAQFDLSGVVGTNVALSGDTALIGAPSHGDDPSLGSGAAYVFVRDSTGTWTQQAKLLALDRAEADALGTAVALSGDTAVIGALGRDDNGSGSGAAYVFVRDSTGTWTQHAKLLASDGIQNDLFGAAVALSGETALVGAFGVAQNSGAAYVFVHDPTTGVWSEQAKLQASDGAPFDDFGIAVALSGETALVGALAGAAISGASYVFEFSGTTVDLLDPVPDLLAELTQTPEQAKAILARAGATVRGVAADGVARVVVRVSVPDLGTVELTLVDDAGIPLARPEEAGFLTQLGGAVGSNSLLVPTVGVPGKGSMAFAVYHAPSNFVRAGSGDANERDRQVSLRLRFAPQVGGASQEAMTSITIARPPVVLVHGLWGSDLSWDGFSPLITDPRFVVRRVNYRMNAAGLSVNAPDVGRQTRSLIRDYKADKRVAAVQADVVTHSMGGLLVRTLPLLGTAFFRNDNFQEGDVHKLINIGTPHTGSELALKLRTKKGRPLCRAMFRSFNVPIDEGAIDDLIPGSERLEALNSFASPIRMHNNAGLASALQKEVNATGMLISALQSPLVCGRILPRGGFDALFKDANDLLVSATSQRARLSPTSPAVSTFTPLIHTRAGGFFDVADGAAELEAEAVSLAVIELLHLPRRDPKFIRLSP